MRKLREPRRCENYSGIMGSLPAGGVADHCAAGTADETEDS